MEFDSNWMKLEFCSTAADQNGAGFFEWDEKSKNEIPAAKAGMVLFGKMGKS